MGETWRLKFVLSQEKICRAHPEAGASHKVVVCVLNPGFVPAPGFIPVPPKGSASLCRQLDCLRQLVVVLCERSQLQDLVEFPYVNLHNEVILRWNHGLGGGTTLPFKGIMDSLEPLCEAGRWDHRVSCSGRGSDDSQLLRASLRLPRVPAQLPER